MASFLYSLNHLAGPEILFRIYLFLHRTPWPQVTEGTKHLRFRQENFPSSGILGLSHPTVLDSSHRSPKDLERSGSFVFSSTLCLVCLCLFPLGLQNQGVLEIVLI